MMGANGLQREVGQGVKPPANLIIVTNFAAVYGLTPLFLLMGPLQTVKRPMTLI